jgi:nucleoside-diphosphate-sugar epimerase
VSIREIAESVTDLVGSGAVEFGPARPGDLKARTVSNERARTELGWSPTTAFADGLARTYAWYQAQAAAEAHETPVIDVSDPAPAHE